MNTKVNAMFILKTLLAVLISLYAIFFEITDFTMKFDACLVLAFSLLFAIKARKNPLVLIIAAFILYSNYSIVMGEYLIGGDLGISYTEVKNIQYYGPAIRILLLFMSIISLFVKVQTKKSIEYKIISQDNLLLYLLVVALLGYVFAFGINREVTSSYSVKITTLYGYSPILFLFGFYFKGKSKLRAFILYLLAAIFILQDFYYGGRITSLQIIILIAIYNFTEKITIMRLILYGFAGIVMSSAVSAYRSAYSLNRVDLLSIINRIFDKFFVFDTSVGAYYATATHIATFEIIDIETKMESFFDFIKSIFLGSGNSIGNVSSYVSQNYFMNGGGGLLPSHFYFWLGWIGVIFVSIIIIAIVNNLNRNSSDLNKLIILAVVSRVPAWYLYNPINLFRGAILVVILFYAVFMLADKITKKQIKRKLSPVSNSLKIIDYHRH